MGLLHRKMSKFLVSMKRSTVFLVTKEIHIKSLSNSTIYDHMTIMDKVKESQELDSA